MATRTTTSTRTRPVVYKSKSDHVRALLDEGKTIAEITRIVPNMGYAFAYGIAKRYGKADSAAHRKPMARVKVDPETNSVVIRPESGGLVRVDLKTGKVTHK